MACCVRGWCRCALMLALAAIAPGWVAAQETEPNDTLAGAQVVAADISGATLVSGELTFIDFDPNVFDTSVLATMTSGDVQTHDFAGYPAGVPYAAYIDNLAGAGAPDTVMRSLDENGDEVDFNDDGSPFGDGFASGILSTVNADGSLHFEVTGFFDYDFDGLDDDTLAPHEQEGDYELFIKLGPFGDTDFFRLTGLLPGSAWSATTVAIDDFPPDTVLTAYDDLGSIVDQNDDISFPANLMSSLGGIVPASGEVILAVTAFPDYTNVGGHLDFGLYDLDLTYTAVPEPSTFAVLAIGSLAGLFVVRRK